MKNQAILFLALTSIITKVQSLRPETIRISADDLTKTVETDFTRHKNFFEIQIVDEEIIENKNLFLIFESTNPNFIVSILDENTNQNQKAAILIDLQTFNGNSVLAMSDSFFNGKLDFFKTNGFLRFKIRNEEEKLENSAYTVRVMVQKDLDVSFGKEYTTRIDSKIENLNVNLSYDGDKHKDLKKLRFQVSNVKNHNKYALSCNLKYKSNEYIMNNIFKNSIGGILRDPILPVCKSGKCVYTFKIQQKGVKIFNFESQFVTDIDVLSINHYGAYYDRTYTKDVVSYYKIPYIKEMEGLNVSISLIPVTGDSGLYANPMSKPLSLDQYAWKETGSLAKRITIDWQELV